ncbi:receptor-like serine/threonine-protein kinase NCRK isoform X2 [Hibiscus syriacus]|uniref:receptor-like serine/threonine-protein kinase NCRK isoform X2 n=1 Tax=Hibiscus syriacus TaxID=106335 RepID=UPI001924361A|nr:receptor-like serine/threonine-protein kinase NCRK isoform X2 [Hibiscus syriacus]
MKLEVEVALACIISLISIQQGLCAGGNNWKCTCSSLYPGDRNSILKSNCSRSCDCNPVESNGDRWTCLCATDGFPKVAVDNHDTTCFSACNCTAGSLPGVPASRKHFPNNIIVIVLLLSVIFITLAFLASVTCYFYRKDKCPKCPIQPSIFLSDIEISCNSATNLISHKSSLVSETKINTGYHTRPIPGCFQKASFLHRSKMGTVLGTVFQFAYSELENSTNKFSDSNLIGLGGSSYVYRGQLKDGRIVAVKRLKVQGGPDADSIFSKEVELLSRLHHCHVVSLLGYCSKSSGKHAKRLLVFEYMPNGNLRDCLNGIWGQNISWEARVSIAMGAAKGLQYLHEAAAPRILHRDVKSTNILLDKNWRAKITDLGMAKRLRADGVPSSSSSPARMQGTFGYFAPEYSIVGRASLMSDVFSFGVVLLELITGRQPIHKSNNKEESLVIWATPLLQDCKPVTSELPDPRLKGKFLEEEMRVMAYLAKECLLLDPDARPTMSEVVQTLSTIAPDKSKRRNIHVNFLQMSSALNVKNESPAERYQSVMETLYDTDEHMSTTSTKSTKSTLPLHMDGIGLVERQRDAVSTECMERLVLLSSNARSLCVPDDEAVDLTEPRLESFHMANVRSPREELSHRQD